MPTVTPPWNRHLRRHDPLTHTYARSVAEIECDPYAWMEGPDERDRARAGNHPAFWMLALALLCLVLTSPRWWPTLFGA